MQTLISLKLFERKASILLHFLIKPLPERIGKKIVSLIFNFLSGLIPLKSFWNYYYAAILSVAIWSCYAFFYHFCLQAFKLEEIYNLAWYAGLVVLVFTTISMEAPVRAICDALGFRVIENMQRVGQYMRDKGISSYSDSPMTVEDGHPSTITHRLNAETLSAFIQARVPADAHMAGSGR